MFRRSTLWSLKIMSPMAVSFEATSLEAKGSTHDFYHRKTFGTSTDYIDIQTPKMELLPFYGCEGSVDATFTASRQETYQSYDSQGKPQTRTRTVNIGTWSMVHPFLSHEAAVYASQKYNQKHVDHVPTAPCLAAAHKCNKSDLDETEVHLFELPIPEVRDQVATLVESAMESSAREICGNSCASISWDHRKVFFNYLQPLYLPVFSVPLIYNGHDYRAFVSGFDLGVRGPYLLNAQMLSRGIGLGAMGFTLLLFPSKLMAIPLSLAAAVVTSFAGDFVAKRYPKFARDWNDSSRTKAKQKAAAANDPESNFRIDPFSAEFETSSFRFDGDNKDYTDHNRKKRAEYEARQNRFNSEWGRTGNKKSYGFAGSSSSSSSSGSGAVGGVDGGLPRDPQGYYRVLGLAGDETLAEVKSAFRKQVMKTHPDHTGDSSPEANDKMVKINEAYRTIRDPKRRRMYDLS